MYILIIYECLAARRWLCYIRAGVNRYFTLCSTNSLAIGGGGHFALYLDGDLWEFCAIFPFTLYSEQHVNFTLLYQFGNSFLIFSWRLNGSSSVSETYGNPCLAHSKEFEVKEVEVCRNLPFLKRSHTHAHAVYRFPYQLYYFWHNISFIMKEQNL